MTIVTTLKIPVDHPTLAGHFPGAPILPGVVLLDAMLREIELSSHQPPPHWQIVAAKFQSAVRPGEPLTLEHVQLLDGSIQFAIRAKGRAVVTGALVPRGSPMESGDGTQA
jgi:3-hydroxymyristoyl/3-hydroxydecanoyl-(acyl carrier protein) dehydratase